MDVKTLKSKTVYSFENNGSVSITSFLNSTFIKTFGHFRHENLSAIYSFQATLSNHIKHKKADDVEREDPLVVKAQTMRYILAVTFLHFLRHVVGQKK